MQSANQRTPDRPTITPLPRLRPTLTPVHRVPSVHRVTGEGRVHEVIESRLPGFRCGVIGEGHQAGPFGLMTHPLVGAQSEWSM